MNSQWKKFILKHLWYLKCIFINHLLPDLRAWENLILLYLSGPCEYHNELRIKI